MIIVTGMHRSGTTFLGRVMEQSCDYDYIHEPFSPNFGIEGVAFRYSYLDLEGRSSETLRQILHDLHALNVTFKKPVVEEKFVKKLARNFVRSRNHLGLLAHRYRFRQREVLFKDPFLSLCGGYLAGHFDDVKIIYVVRHPLAIYRSVQRMGWEYDFVANILPQNELVRRYCPDFVSKLSGVDGIPEQVAYLWKIIYRVVAEQAAALGGKALLFNHEGFCSSPHESIGRVFDFLGKEVPDDVSTFITRKMFGGKVMPKGDILHDFARNAKDLAWAWKKSYSPVDDRILEIIGDDLSLFY